MGRDRPRSSSRDTAEGLSKNEGGLEKGQAVASGLEKGQESRGGPYRKEACSKGFGDYNSLQVAQAASA